MELKQAIDAYKRLLGDLATLGLIAAAVSALALLLLPSSTFQIEHRITYSILVEAGPNSPEIQRAINRHFSGIEAQDYEEAISATFDRVMGSLYAVDTPREHADNDALRLVSVRSKGLGLKDILSGSVQENQWDMAAAEIHRQLPVLRVQSNYSARAAAGWFFYPLAILTIASIATLHLRRKTFANPGPSASPQSRAKTIAIILPVLCITGITASLLVGARSSQADGFAQTLELWMSDPLMRTQMFVVAVFFAPIFEELLCRRFILGRFLAAGHVVTGFALASFAFVWLHVGRGAFMGLTIELSYLMLFYLIASLLLCYTYFKTRNILDAMLVHGLYNLMGWSIWFWAFG